MPQPLSYIEKGFSMSYQDLKDCKIITAFITPFHEDGSINFDAIPKLIEHLLAHHTDGILLAGTTAESPTLTHDEELQLFAASLLYSSPSHPGGLLSYIPYSA